MNIKKVSGTNFGMATIKSTNALKQTLGYLLKEKHFSPKEINDEFKQIHKFWPKESDVVEIEKFEGIWNGFNRNFKEVIGKLTTNGKAYKFSVLFDPNDFAGINGKSKSLPNLIRAITGIEIPKPLSIDDVKNADDLMSVLTKKN